jgi:hypothetical protein
MIGADMTHDAVERPAAVERWILDLHADLRERLAYPSHFPRRKAPGNLAWHPPRFEIRPLMTDRTAHRRKAKTVAAARDRRLMELARVALARAIPGRVTIHATRMREYFGGLRE